MGAMDVAWVTGAAEEGADTAPGMAAGAEAAGAGVAGASGASRVLGAARKTDNGLVVAVWAKAEGKKPETPATRKTTHPAATARG
jgi:hypothetical protein